MGPADVAWQARAFARDTTRRDAALLAIISEAAAWAAGRQNAVPPMSRPQGATDWALPTELVAAQRTWLESADAAGLAAYVPALARAYAGGPEDAEHLSSEPIIDVIVTALAARVRPQDGATAVVYDPVCGTAGTLLAAAHAVRDAGADVQVFGQDVSREASYIASTAVAVSGISGGIATGNSLAADRWPDV